MAYTIDTDHANLVRNFVNHTVVTDVDTPVVLASGKFTATRRAWVCRKRLDRCDDPIMNLGGEP